MGTESEGGFSWERKGVITPTRKPFPPPRRHSLIKALSDSDSDSTNQNPKTEVATTTATPKRPQKHVYSMKKGQIVRVNKEKYLNSVNECANKPEFMLTSSDEEWYEPSFDPPVLEDSDGSLCDGDENPTVCSKAASLEADENRVYKAEKVDDHWDFKPFGDESYGFEVLLGSDLDSVISSSNFSLRSSLLDSIKDRYLSSCSSSSDDAEDEDKIDLSILKGFETEKENNNQQST